jgi:hypothetical protein
MANVLVRRDQFNITPQGIVQPLRRRMETDDQPFKLVGADAGRYRLPRLVQIGFDLAFAQVPHRHSGNTDIGKHYLA